MGWIAYERSTGIAKYETKRDPGRIDPSLALYVIPEELTNWKETHRWDEASRSLVPMAPVVKSQERIDAERILTGGIANDADRGRLLLMIARQVLRPERM